MEDIMHISDFKYFIDVDVDGTSVVFGVMEENPDQVRVAVCSEHENADIKQGDVARIEKKILKAQIEKGVARIVGREEGIEMLRKEEDDG